MLEGKQIKTYYYTKDNTQTAPYIVKTSTHYITSAQLSGGRINISGKDGLKDLEKNSAKFPQPTNLSLTSNISETDTQIPYEGENVTFIAGNVIKIGRELMQVISSSAGVLTVQARGNDITKFGEVISTTEASSHELGDAIQKCLPENSDIDIVLLNIFSTAGILQFANTSQWSQEVDAWNAGAKIKGVYHEPKNCDEVINQILTDYTLDMYLDQNTNKAVLSSVSQWLEPTIKPVREGNDFTAYKEQVLNNERFSRAFIKTNKANQTDNDDLTNYERIALFTDIETETSDFYGDIKTNEFEPSQTLQFNDAQVLVKRFVDRYSVPPKQIMFNMEERKITNIDLGDVIDIKARDKQLYDGTREEAFNRAQVIKIQPRFNQIGRNYDVTCLSYIPEFGNDPGPLIFDSNTTTGINIYNALGNPNVPVNAVVVFDGADFGSDNVNIPTIRAGALAAGSTVKIFCINGARVGAKGGKGGDAQVIQKTTGQQTLTGLFFGEASAEDGEKGGTIYDSDGIETHFYINYNSVDGYTSDATLFAPGGGSGGASNWLYNVIFEGGDVDRAIAIANGGCGGSGLIPGEKGIASQNYPVNRPFDEGQQRNGEDGGFDSSGSGFEIEITDLPQFTYRYSIESNTGDGGISEQSQPSISIAQGVNPTPGNGGVFNSLSFGSQGDSGEAFTGGNITVYNLAADASKLRDGSSTAGVDYTLVTS